MVPLRFKLLDLKPFAPVRHVVRDGGCGGGGGVGHHAGYDFSTGTGERNATAHHRIPPLPAVAYHILARMLDEALYRGKDGLLVGLRFRGTFAEVERFRQQIDDAQTVAKHVLGVLWCIVGEKSNCFYKFCAKRGTVCYTYVH